MDVEIFLDESGDFGWSLAKPYGKGGSSRYLTLAAVIVPVGKAQFLTRIIRGFYKKRKRNIKKELKSTSLSAKERQQFVEAVVRLIKNHPDIKVLVITVNKQNVIQALRNDVNGFYNYITKLLLLDELKSYQEISLMPDSRSIKTAFQNSLHVYLHQMLIEKSAEDNSYLPKLSTTLCESQHCLEIQFADIVASLYWSKYEFGDQTVKELTSLCSIKTLYF